MFRFVINPKYINLLSEIRYNEKTMKDLSKKCGMNYFHLTEVLNQFYREGIILKENRKNTYYISLTEKGQKITEHLLEIRSIMIGDEKNE